MMFETLESIWADFSLAVIPLDAPAEQYKEMKRAFYAGAWCLLQAIQGFDENVSADEVSHQLQAWEDECRQFNQDVSEGRA